MEIDFSMCYITSKVWWNLKIPSLVESKCSIKTDLQLNQT